MSALKLPRRPSLTRGRLLLALAAVAGIVLRVWAYRATIGTPNADEAVVGLMVRHALDGELTAFYWGQAYGGTQEVLLTAPLFAVFGSSWLALRLVPIVLNAVAAVLVWRVGRRTIGEPAAGVAGAVFWVWPGFNVFVLTHQQGFYASNVLYSALLLLLALRVVERPDRVRVGMFGLVLGLAFWQSPQIVPLAAGVIGWTVWKCPGALRLLPVAVPLAVLGALPWLVWNVEHGWESLVQPEYGDRLGSLRLLASPVLPMMVGLRESFSGDLLIPSLPLTYAIYVGLLAAFVFGAVRTGRREVSILYAVTAVFPLVYALSPKTSLALGTPRFIVVLTPVLALLLAQLATTLRRSAAVLGLVLVVSVATLQGLEEWFDGSPRRVTHQQGLGPRHAAQWVPRDLTPLADALDRLAVSHVYADYWLAYRLTFDTGERIVAAENRLDGIELVGGRVVAEAQPEARYEPYQRAVRAADAGFVFYRETLDSVTILAELEARGYRPHAVDGFVVYAPARW